MLSSVQDIVAKAAIALIGLSVCAGIWGPEATIFLLAVGVLYWIAARLWGVWRSWQSYAAAKRDAAAMALERPRFQSILFKFLCYLVVVVTFGLVVLLCVSGGMDWLKAAVAGGIAATLCGSPLWVKATRCWRQYEQGFKSDFVATTLSGVFDNLKYDPDGKVCGSDLRALDFFEHFDRFSGNDLIEAEYKGVRFEQSDVRVLERYTVKRGGGKGSSRETVRWRTIFFGRAMRFDFADPFRGPVQVVQKDFRGAKVRASEGWHRIETELAEFAIDFDIFSRDPVDAMAVLTPMMVEGIFYLYHKLACPMAFYFTGNAMFVFFPLKRDSFDVSASRTLLEERKHLKQDVATVTGFLDTMYFKRQADADPPAGADAAETRANPPGPNAVADSRPGPEARREEFVRSSAVEAARLKRNVVGGAEKVIRVVMYVLFAVYILGLLYALYAFPDGIALGFSYTDGKLTLRPADVPISVYVVLINGFFILPIMVAACFKRASLVVRLTGLLLVVLIYLILYWNSK